MIAENDGVDLQPISQNADKYADYLALNPDETSEAGTSKEETAEPSADKPADVKQEEVPSPSKEQEHVPNWRRKIDKQTKHIKQLKAEIEALKAKDVQAPKDRYKRENFATDAEYEEYEEQRLDKLLEAKLSARMLQEKTATLETIQAETSEEKFRNVWAEKVEKHYGNNPEDLRVLTGITSDNKFLASLPESVHDYMEDAEYAPVMMHVLFLRPDLVERISDAKPMVQAKILWDLENEIKQATSGKTQAQPVAQVAKPVSNAPSPIGKIGNSGQAIGTEDESDEATYARLLKQRQLKRGR